MTRKNDLEWSPVCLSQIFTFERGKENNMASLVEGETPLVSARKVNNGIKGFVANPSKIIKGRNVLSLNNDGDGGAGLAFYQCVDFALDSHVTALHSKTTLSAQTLLFIAACISKQHAIFGHGYSISLPRAKRILSMLPVDDSGNPDYQYMAEYISAIRNSFLKNYTDFLSQKIAKIGNHVDIEPLTTKNRQAFHIADLFSVSRPVARNKNDYSDGNIPFVASGSNNNGVFKLCSAIGDEKLDEGNCITVSPVDGSAFYQPIDFLGRGGAGSSILILRCSKLNKYNGPFIARAIKQTTSKYNYGHMGNKDNIKRELIMLPIDESGDPDYEYMEQYAKNMMIQKYQQYLNFIASKQG